MAVEPVELDNRRLGGTLRESLEEMWEQAMDRLEGIFLISKGLL